MILQTEQIAATSSVPTLPSDQTPTMLDKPAFLLNFPFSFSAACANNAWMKELSPDER